MEPVPDSLPEAVYTTAEVRELDRIAIEDFQIAGFELMQRAAQAAFEALRRHWPRAHRLLIYCGAGNNGGDGYVLAGIAKTQGMAVRAVSVGVPAKLTDDAARAFRQAVELGVERVDWSDGPTTLAGFAPDLVVDALLGTGLTRAVDGPFAAAVAFINTLRQPVLALDIPSGLDGDRGLPLGEAVRADLTITFVGLKQGLFLGAAPDYRGELVFSDLAIPPRARAGTTPALTRLGRQALSPLLDPRLKTAHKGLNGSLLLVGGDPDMPGAVRLAAEAALRVGAGLVYVAAHPDSVASVRAGRPEIICRGAERVEDIADWLRAADAVVLGPGLGRTEWAVALWQGLLDTPLPVLLDADGLNLLAERPRRRGDWVLTPHPGEAARLLGTTVAEIQADRLRAVRSLWERFGATVVLKGACSLIGQAAAESGFAVSVCDHGNSGMATAGMGDVLSGAIGGLIVQAKRAGRGDLAAAARAGVLLHALAGDDAAADGSRGLIASDLMPHLRRWANPR